MKTQAKLTCLVLASAILSVAVCGQAQFSISPLATFSPNGDGWLAPGEGGYAYLGTVNNERGLAYGNGHLYLVSRSGGSFIRILDPLTGADLGSLNNSGISGGTFAVNMVSVGGDGAIYVGNLTTQATTTPYKVYKWATEGSAPVVAYSGTPLAGGRVGDTLDAIGSGSSTLLAAGFGNSPIVAGNNSYAIIDPTAGTHAQITFSGTPPNAGDFRLGITFTDASHVLGTQGASSAPSFVRYTSFSGSAGTLVSSFSPFSFAERLMDYAMVGGVPLLATQSTGDSTVRIYDFSDPSSPVLLGSGNNTSGSLTANGNGTGAVAWGDISGNTAKLWAMSSNQGIQAFVVVVPEPGTLTLAALGGLALLVVLQRRRASR
jgi:hypothetical protein